MTAIFTDCWELSSRSPRYLGWNILCFGCGPSTNSFSGSHRHWGCGPDWVFPFSFEGYPPLSFAAGYRPLELAGNWGLFLLRTCKSFLVIHSLGSRTGSLRL